MLPSDDSHIIEKAAKELGLSQLVPAVYQDLLQPLARELGERLVVIAQTIGLALAPLEVTVWGYQRIKDYLAVAVAKKLANKPPEEIISPDPVVAGPVIMNMIFTANAPYLREMYANLIACAMNSPFANKAHPSFSCIIQQLSSHEAQILQEIAKNSKAGQSILFEEILLNGTISPVSSEYLFMQWRALCAKFEVTDKVIADAFYHNLIRLGILIERSDTEAKYIPEGSDRYGDWGAKVETKTNNYVTLTDYGDLFLDVCVRDA